MARVLAVFSGVTALSVAGVLWIGCASTTFAQDSGTRIRLLEEKLIQAYPGSLPEVSYAVRDMGLVAGAVRLALPEAGGHALVLDRDGQAVGVGGEQQGSTRCGRYCSAPRLGGSFGDLDSVVAIAAGAAHSVALREDGSVWTWGANEYGQSGDGSLWVRNRPERVPGLRDVVAGGGGDAIHPGSAARRNGMGLGQQLDGCSARSSGKDTADTS